MADTIDCGPPPPLPNAVQASHGNKYTASYTCVAGYQSKSGGTVETISCYRVWQTPTTGICEDINECASSPCRNGATCTDAVNSYTCLCVAGYTGKFCEDIDECASSPCENEGTCTDAVNSYTCRCVAGYTGTHCETDIDECASIPCEHGATCTDAVNSYTCRCVAGYTGTHCETDIDECDSNPCENDATCTDAVISYTCDCVAGYTATHCESEIDECTSSPCRNEGTCTDAVNSYTCRCVAGYTGTHCETDIDECASSPCRNEATCSDAVNSYTCRCVAGFTGTHCESDIDECDSNPCENDATCTDAVNSYTCDCVAGYTGTHCDTEIHCPILTPPRNALVTSDPGSTVAESVVTYECREGYKLDTGSLQLMCNLDGHWSADPPQCKAILCPAPECPSFAEVVKETTPYVYGTIVTYACQTGFELIAGDTERTCLANRRWSGVKPLCRIVSCGSLAPVAHALYDVPEETTYMTGITYHCEEGYKRGVGGDWTRTCLENKQWSGTSPVCLEIKCTKPREINNTLMDVGGTRMNDYAYYECVDGFRLEGGSTTKRCNKDEEWEGEDPVCVEIRCSEPRQIEHAQMVTTGRKLNAKAVYRCKTGFEQASGNNTAVCKESGHWSDVALVCRAVTCGAPPQPVHTLVVESGEGISGTADYDCEKGYQLTSGTTRSSCTAQGLWTDVTIKCQPSGFRSQSSEYAFECCPELLGRYGISQSYSSTDVDCVAFFVKVDCHRAIGVQFLQEIHVHVFCSLFLKSVISLSWPRFCGLRTFLTLSITCPVTATTAHVVIVNQTGVQLDDTVTLACEPGYHHVSGSTIRTCLWTRDWSDAPITCEETMCKEPMPVLGARVSYPSLSVHASATYRCSEGYRAAGGDFSHTCQVDGTWSGQRPTCEEILCGEIRVPENSSLIAMSGGLTPGSRTSFQCVPGYTIATGDNETRCSPEGQWDRPLPRCEKIDCGSPPAVSNAHTESLTGTTFMETAKYACDEGYKADVIEAPLVCGKSASWLGEPLNCNALPLNCRIESTSLSYKSTIVYKCHKRFVMVSGDKHRTCQWDGSWNGTEPTCAVKRCSGPPAVANTTWYVDKKSFEQRVIYKCLPRFHLVSGELAKVCSSDLKWTGEDPVCVESTESWDFVVEKDEPKTPKEKAMAKIGYKKSDEKVDHVATGIVASVILALSVAAVIALDAPLLYAHLKMMRRNVYYGLRRLRRRGAVSPEGHQTVVSPEPPDCRVTGEPPDHPVTRGPSDHRVTREPSDHRVTRGPPDRRVTTEPPDRRVTRESPDRGVTREPSNNRVTTEPIDRRVTRETPDRRVTRY
ncbi:hypothetical protein NP493_778g04036 [Ridgeia piscesae]|uniref:Uncharacterized protein n=1 Tax=Ridgeia piscesae TaxID=27915 RepID=A0AAD9NLU9_RIDPI|nr:hypothetical protein NP493_778g04036 [Ridgeia piscesae]